MNAADASDGKQPACSPVARRLAEAHDVDLATVEGTGPRGRIVRRDVEDAIARLASEHSTSAKAAASIHGTVKGETSRDGDPGGDSVVLTRAQQTIARRMTEAKATVPEFTVECEVAMGRCLELRNELKEAAQPAPSLNDLVVKACGAALREFPQMNSTYAEDTFRVHPQVDIGIAVAAPGSLLVPVIRDVDRKQLNEIAAESRRLTEHARRGGVPSAELGGATFTVSNLGMLGVTRFTAVIDPPQAGILAVGACVERGRAIDGKLQLAPVMAMTLTCDHRVVYGADGARFLGKVRELLERPSALLAGTA